MANNSDDMTKVSKRIDKRLDDLDSSMNDLYRSTYQSRIDDKQDMNNIVGNIDNTIDSLLSKINGKQASDLSNLYTRIQKKGGMVGSFEEELSKLFDDSGQILDTISQ